MVKMVTSLLPRIIYTCFQLAGNFEFMISSKGNIIGTIRAL